MLNFALILVCLFAGVCLRRVSRFPAGAPQAFNAFVIYISLPALILVQVPALLASTRIDASILAPLTMPWLHFFLSIGFFAFLGRWLKWDRKRVGALVLTAGLGNTSFIGFPMVEALLGREALPIAIVLDQAGTFLALSTIGLATAAFYSGAEMRVGAIMKRVATFPPLIALVVSLGWHAAGLYKVESLTSLLDKIASTLVPLALVSIGLQLNVRMRLWRRCWKPLATGLAFKLVLAPLLFLGIYHGLFSIAGLTLRTTILEAAMAPMVTAAIVAADFDLDSEVASLVLGVGILFSFMTVPLWHLVLHTWF